MFENIVGFFKKLVKKETEEENNKDMAKERLHLVLMQDRANVSADFLDMMKQEIIDVIKKYIDVDESEIDVHLTNKTSDDGTTGPALYANIPIVSIKHSGDIDEETKEKVKEQKSEKQDEPKEEQVEEKKEESEVKENEEEKVESEEKKEDSKDEKVEETIIKENPTKEDAIIADDEVSKEEEEITLEEEKDDIVDEGKVLNLKEEIEDKENQKEEKIEGKEKQEVNQ